MTMWTKTFSALILGVAVFTAPAAWAKCYADIGWCTDERRATASELRGQPCAVLWGMRNGIYRESNYCFKTDQAIRVFGNEGCLHNEMGDVPLTPVERDNVAKISRVEREKSCPR